VHNEELRNLYSSLNMTIIKVIISGRMRSAHSRQMKNAYTVLVGEPEDVDEKLILRRILRK